jgi:hypothetical protein
MLAYNILTTKKKRKGGVKVNFLPVIIGVLLFSLFSDKGGGKQSGGSGNAIDMENIQNTVGAINSFNKLGGKDTDKMSVVMELMSNPVVAELVGKFLGNQPTSGAGEEIHNDGATETEQDYSASSGQDFNARDTSASEATEESEEFFRPVENIAGVEVSEKLRHLYDNWYTKK